MWEDGYYNNQNEADQSESKNVNETLDGLQNGHVTYDSLALAMAKMSYHVYSQGEGIVGWVAVTGEHQWIFTGEHDVTSYSTLNPCNDAWQAQFAAGIKTNVVAAVFPHGVVQFGSLNAVKENVRFLAHIRDVFSANQESVCQTRLRCNPVSSICRKRVLTWEDGYYNNQNEADQSESKNFNETLDGLQNGHVTHDSLALDVAKMSYHVYSLGEGIVGRVAVTREHQWIFTGEHDVTSYSTLNPCDDAWQAQFAAGIKTIVVAAVFPHGVIQFGSLNAVKENVRFLAHNRDVFSANQESVCQIQTPLQSSLQHMSQTISCYKGVEGKLLQWNRKV